MTVKGLDHCTILAADLAASRDFYVEVLGLTDGARPPFDFPGHWLYCDDRPVVHLVGGERARGAQSGSAAVDHVAFAADDIEATRADLQARGIEFQEREVPRLGQRQLFLRDPNGIKIELNFPLMPGLERFSASEHRLCRTGFCDLRLFRRWRRNEQASHCDQDHSANCQ